MTTTRALLLALSLTPCLAACDKHDDAGDDHGADDSSGGMTEGDGASETGASETGASETGASETGAPGSTGELVPGDTPCDAEHFGDGRACEGGVQFCASDYGTMPTYSWGPCLAEPACTPGQMIGTCSECQLDVNGVPGWIEICGGGESTPLVLRFDEPVRFASSSADFDLGPQCGATDWPDAATPWLALDRDGSGTIDGGHELFGSATRLLAGGTAENGFVALAELDRDGDGRISAADPEFARLLLWSDRDADRRSTAWELDPIAATGLVSIELTYRSDRQCDVRGNCEVERAAFTYRDRLGRERTGEVVDVHLACQ